jgi:hypothetical protein
MRSLFARTQAVPAGIWLSLTQVPLQLFKSSRMKRAVPASYHFKSLSLNLAPRPRPRGWAARADAVGER